MGKTKKPVINAGANINIIRPILALCIVINKIKVKPTPEPNNIKSVIVKTPKINCDFLELAGIK